MILYPPSLKAVGGARTGIAPANLLDVQDVNGNLYYWSDRPLNVPVVITGAIPALGLPPVPLTPPTAPFTLLAGQSLTWAFPTSASFPAGGTGSASGSDTTAALAVSGAPGGSPYAGTASASFGTFVAPALPAGVLSGTVYPVVTVDINISECAFYPDNSNFPAFIGLSKPIALSGTSAGPAQTVNPDNYPGGLPGWLAHQTSDWGLANSLSPVAAFDDILGISFLGFAIAYTGPGPVLGTAPPSGWNLPGELAYGNGPYLPWLVKVPSFAFNRSLKTDIGSFVLQNLSGDTLSRDFEKIARRGTLEGALFVYRLYQVDAAASWLEVHGTLTVGDVGVDTVQLKGAQLLNPSQEDTPLEIFAETCQLQWGGRRCGSTQSTECQYSFQTCQVVERPMMALNDYEKNYGEAAAVTALNVINRRRMI
jgi:hypothetical protein